MEVDPPKHDHIPYYVEMHRCMGQCTGIASISPLRCECVPATTQDVTLRVTTPTGFNLKTFKNHTSCTSQCKASYKNKCQQDGHNWDENTCTCSCPQPRTTSGTCPQNQVWNTRSCQCECPRSPASCSLNMAWNKSSCSCQCSVMAFAKCSKNGWATDLKTCRCVRRRRPVIPGQVSNTESKYLFPFSPCNISPKYTTCHSVITEDFTVFMHTLKLLIYLFSANESQTKLVVSLVVIALLLGTLFIIDSVLLFSKKGFMYGLVTKCKEKKTKEDFISKF